MTAAPKAISQGSNAGAFAAFTGKSAAKTGPDTASNAATITSVFISGPSIRVRKPAPSMGAVSVMREAIWYRAAITRRLKRNHLHIFYPFQSVKRVLLQAVVI